MNWCRNSGKPEAIYEAEYTPHRFSDAEKAKKCAEMLSQTQILPSMNIREGSIFADGGDSRKTFDEVNRWLLEKDIPFTALEMVQPSLEDVFLKLTGTERR